MFTKSEKIIIYNLLLEKYPLNTLINKDDLENYLIDNGLDSKQYGYNSYINLFKDLSEFLKEEKKENQICYLLKNYTDNVNLNDQIKKDKKTMLTKNISIINKKKKLTIEDKNLILNLLAKKFQQKKFYLLSIVSQYLENNNIHYTSYGYSKMKLLLFQIEEIKIVDKIVNNIPVTYVSFSLNDVNNNIKRSNNDIPQFKDVFIPPKLISSLINQLGNCFDEKKVISLIENDYKKEINNINEIGDSFSFKLSIKDKDNDDIIVCIKKSTSKTTYKYFVSFIGSDNNQSAMYFKLLEFSDYEKALFNLSKLAKNEMWCFKNSKDKFLILKIYLQYTFSKLYLDNKIAYSKDETLICFNTGLVTPLYEDIYFIGHLKDKNDKKYSFDAFTTLYNSLDGKKIVENFNPLPLKASYYKDESDLFFFKDKMIIANYDHILLDNITRLPLKFIFKYTINKNIKDIIKKLERCNEKIKDKLYFSLVNEIKKDEVTYSSLKFALEKAINYSIKQASIDYHSVLASYFPTRNVFSLLLPISFDTKIDCFLVVEKMSSSNYQLQTILTLKQAYTNSRLISPLNNTYLKANEIED